MQDIKKKCDKCKEQEAIRKTIDEPKPDTAIIPVKVTGRGKVIKPFEMDLCLNCHTVFSAISLKWVNGDASLDDFK